jgi:hypothetical protein
MPESDLHKTEALLKQSPREEKLIGNHQLKGEIYTFHMIRYIHYRRFCKLIGSRKTVNRGCCDDKLNECSNLILSCVGYGMRIQLANKFKEMGHAK